MTAVRTPTPFRRPASSRGDGNGGNIEVRLREAEGAIRELRREFRTELKHLASKTDIYKVVLAGIGLAAAIAVAISRWIS